MKKEVISALYGLAGAVGNNGKTSLTDGVIISALLMHDEAAAVKLIHEEKLRLAPDCMNCAAPCGNTSDRDIRFIEAGNPEITALKETVYSTLCSLAASSKGKGMLPDSAYNAIYALCCELSAESYRNILEELQNDT